MLTSAFRHELRCVVTKHEAGPVARREVELLRHRIYHYHDDDVEQVRHGFQPLELEDVELLGGDVEGRRPVEEVPGRAVRAEIPELDRGVARDRPTMPDKLGRETRKERVCDEW